LNKKIKIQNNGRNGNKLKRRDLMIRKKKLKNLTNKMINFGHNSIKKNKLIGNKNIMLIGFNGK